MRLRLSKVELDRARARWRDTFRASAEDEAPGVILVELTDGAETVKVEIGTGDIDAFVAILRAAQAEGRRHLRERAVDRDLPF